MLLSGERDVTLQSAALALAKKIEKNREFGSVASRQKVTMKKLTVLF